MHLTAPSHWSRSIVMGGRDASEQVDAIIGMRTDNSAATFAALFGVSIMAILAGSLGCPTAELLGTKALANSPLVNVLLEIGIALPRKSGCLMFTPFALRAH
jgi:hypothetical protein